MYKSIHHTHTHTYARAHACARTHEHIHTHTHTRTHTHIHSAIVNRRDHTHSLTQLDYGTENIDTVTVSRLKQVGIKG